MRFLHKSIAIWLVVLVLLPFTAPFAACDLDSLSSESGESPAPSPRRGSPARPFSGPARRAPRGSRGFGRPTHETSSDSERVGGDDAVPRSAFAPNPRASRQLPAIRAPLSAAWRSPLVRASMFLVAPRDPCLAVQTTVLRV
jgi:hypothetical protein